MWRTWRSRAGTSFAYSRSQQGLSFVELLLAFSVLAVLAVSTAALLAGALQAQEFSAQQDELLQAARLAMERMVSHIRRANRILLPLENNPTRAILALGGFVDNDGDGLYDEDPPADLTADRASGIAGVDDDGDSLVDESGKNDDDEDGQNNEDPVNGLDDDGDGAVDEDSGGDLNGDGASGLAGVDDNGNGVVDEADKEDDDEDGRSNEDPVEPLVYFLSGTILWEQFPLDATTSATTALVEQVETFQVQRLIGANGATLLNLLLRVRDGRGRVVELQTQVFPRNLR
ncbi:MAG: hypothetical protein KatS3mg131_0115 [Candidatus Tectimicrobiota bacterium]|nr:MAG: hypothetical protein KatS3mg131_0115 [Candidatus Tectomicrobia bacterium]